MKTFKFKLYNNHRLKHLSQKIDCFGIAWNYCLMLQKKHFEWYGKHLSENKLKAYLTKKKKRDSLLKSLDAQALQQVVERLQITWDNFFDYVKAKKSGRNVAKKGPPKFKKVKKYKSFTLKQSGWKILDNVAVIFRKKYKFWKSREIEGNVKTITIKRDSLGDFWLFVVADAVEMPKYSSQGQSCGIDFSLKNYLVFDTGHVQKSPEFFKQFSKQIAVANRRLSSKLVKSNNREKSLRDLNLVYREVANRRQDFHYKLAHKLCKEFAVICIEDLNLQEMKSRFGKKVSDLCFNDFVRILTNIAVKYGTSIVKISKWFPSSKTCSLCEHVNGELKLSDREWDCDKCKTHLDRDLNAARNIKKEGLRIFKEKQAGAPACAGAGVRRLRRTPCR